jgi:hypothetical protein
MSLQHAAHDALTVALLFALALLALDAAAQTDADADGVPDADDNCIEVANNQYDADADGYGNACDADFDDDGFVGASDFQYILSLIGSEGDDIEFDPAVDLDGDARIGILDFRILLGRIAMAPGPSGLACAGNEGCALPAPIPSLGTVVVDDASPHDGRLDQYDIDVAKTECGTGCNLLFLADVYHDVVTELRSFDAGLALYGFGPGLTVLESPLFDPPESMQPVLVVTGLAPDGLVIRDLALDGRKALQRPPLDEKGDLDTSLAPRSSGIRTISMTVRSDGLLANLEVRNFLKNGIELADLDNWVVEDNHVHDIGCNQVVTPCGVGLGLEPNPWDLLPDLDGVPNHRLSGFGIILMRRVTQTTVRNNHIVRAMKHGIQHFGAKCSTQWATRDNLIAENLVESSRTGIVINGGCSAEFRDNVVRLSGLPGSEAINYGNGFECGADAEGSVWIGNTVEDVQHDGFSMGCWSASDILFVDNHVTRACQNTTRPGAGLTLDGDAVIRPTGAVIDRLTITDSEECFYGIRIRRREGVEIFDSTIDGAFYGVEVTESKGVVVRDSVLTSDLSAGGRGVSFNYEDVAFPIEDVFIHTTTVVSGFASEAGWSAPGTGPDDGDSVAYCKQESVPPSGCDNAAPQ